jgi:succinyl-CoA synthetase beta subunit
MHLQTKAYADAWCFEENPIEVEAKEVGLNYVDLDGTGMYG